MIQTDILIVGGGIAGLLAAQTLRGRGLQVTLVAKGVRVGGRLATRRVGPGRGDHGAQFFSARAPEFQALVNQWLAEGQVFHWSDGFGNGYTEKPHFDGHPRYAVKGGMNNLPQYLARQLQPEVTVEVGTRLASLVPAGDGWQAQTDDGRMYTSRAVILTTPVPRALELLQPDLLAPPDRDALTAIEYAPCLAAVFWVSGAVTLPEPGAIQRPNELVSWVADNQQKGVSPEATVITVHTGPEYSRQMWNMAERSAVATLQGALEPFLAPGSVIKEGQLKAWRFALPTTLYPERHLLAANLPPLIFAGDAFGGPRIEGAALSGMEAGRVGAAQLQL
jgi:predicted NAD/FAD-dependent oxidoreductase